MDGEADWTASALFSPSKARIQQAQAKDWSFVEAWLVRRYGSKRLPSFERSDETLQALLRLASANESADEQRLAAGRLERAALQVYSKATPGIENQAREAALSYLDADGQQSLKSIAESAVALEVSRPNIEMLASNLIELTSECFETSQQVNAVGHLERYLMQEHESARNLLKELNGEAFQSQSDLPERTAELQRNSKHLRAKIVEYDERLAGDRPQQADGRPIEDVSRESLKLFAHREQLHQLLSDLAAYQSLPSDGRKALKMVEQAKDELRALTMKRDDLFEKLATSS